MTESDKTGRHGGLAAPLPEREAPPPRRHALNTLSLLGAMTLAACGGGSDSPAPSPSPTPTPTPPPASSPSTNAALAGLSLSLGTLSPAFTAETLS